MRSFKLFFVLGLFSLVLAGCSHTAPASTEADPTMMQSEKNALKTMDQPAASAVMIATVNLEEPGFVVIHADNDNKPGAIIGSSALLSGTNENLAVTATTEAGKSYWAMLHGDDGNQKFSAAQDAPLKNAQGSILMVKFMAQ